METITPAKLKTGDEIRVISPSDSLARVGGMEENLVAKERLEAIGFKVTFGAHIDENDILDSAKIESRVADLHAAFLDPNVKGILATIGGETANELLPYIDWEIIRNNPKVFCGYSDTTALHAAIFAKTGLVTYYGPSYSSFKMTALQSYQTNSFVNAVVATKPQPIVASEFWASDPWFLADYRPDHQPNTWKTYTDGKVTGIVLGGNIDTLYLTFGTPFQPDLTVKPILLVEQAEGTNSYVLARQLAQLLQVCPHPKGLIIGRAPKETGTTEEMLLYILAKYPVLKQIPVIYDVNVGHAQPIATIPLGAVVTLDATHKQILI